MAAHPNPSAPQDSLDLVEIVRAMEEAVIFDTHLTHAQRESLMREIEALIAQGEFGDDDDDTLAALVRRLGPRSPHNRAGAAAEPDEPPAE